VRLYVSNPSDGWRKAGVLLPCIAVRNCNRVRLHEITCLGRSSSRLGGGIVDSVMERSVIGPSFRRSNNVYCNNHCYETFLLWGALESAIQAAC
jgi:hypothetical protein